MQINENSFFIIQNYIVDYLRVDNQSGISPYFCLTVLKNWTNGDCFKLKSEYTRNGIFKSMENIGFVRDYATSYSDLLQAYTGDMTDDGWPMFYKDKIAFQLKRILQRNIHTFCQINAFPLSGSLVWSPDQHKVYPNDSEIRLLRLQTTIEVLLNDYISQQNNFKEFTLNDFFQYYMACQEEVVFL